MCVCVCVDSPHLQSYLVVAVEREEGGGGGAGGGGRQGQVGALLLLLPEKSIERREMENEKIRLHPLILHRQAG